MFSLSVCLQLICNGSFLLLLSVVFEWVPSDMKGGRTKRCFHLSNKVKRIESRPERIGRRSPCQGERRSSLCLFVHRSASNERKTEAMRQFLRRRLLREMLGGRLSLKSEWRSFNMERVSDGETSLSLHRSSTIEEIFSLRRHDFLRSSTWGRRDVFRLNDFARHWSTIVPDLLPSSMEKTDRSTTKLRPRKKKCSIVF